ncbi:hypothetical protein [Streptomyces mirabilis]|uniref:hypothetical protein n=1 Tax=Streptomyces mirabilis TaxID=68239 RepID=UPI0037242C63
MNGLTLTLHALHHGEKHLAEQLTTVADRHRAEHEVHHVATDLAQWSREHVQRLAEAAHAHSLADSPSAAAGVLSAQRERADEVVMDRPEPGLLLLRDLRELHLSAVENSLHWELLAQIAQATKDEGLLAVVCDCHPRTLRQMRWSNTMIKNLAPQILTSL